MARKNKSSSFCASRRGTGDQFDPHQFLSSAPGSTRSSPNPRPDPGHSWASPDFGFRASGLPRPSVFGLLTQRGLETVADEAQRRAEFDRGFAFLPETRRADLSTALWSGRLAQHNRLLEIAVNPRGLQGTHAPLPGAACPSAASPPSTGPKRRGCVQRRENRLTPTSRVGTKANRSAHAAPRCMTPSSACSTWRRFVLKGAV